MGYDIDTANYADLKTLEDRVRRTLYAHGFNENTSTPLGDMNSLCRNLVQDAAATDAELAALQARLAEAEAQRAVLVAALEDLITRADEADRLLPYGHGLRTLPARQALANQPPSDLVALVKAASRFFPAEHALDVWCAENPGEPIPSELSAPVNAAHAAAHDALDTLLTNQPGFRALIDREDV